MDMERTPSPGPPGRSIDIELGSAQEVITIDLDGLDPNPDDVLELLKEGNCKVWMWTKLAGEYWRRGWLDAAEKLALAGVECEYLKFSFRQRCVETYHLVFKSLQANSSLPPVYTLLANIRMARARQAPKMRLEGARKPSRA